MLCAWVAASWAAGFTGTFKGTQDSVEFTLELVESGGKLTGKATSSVLSLSVAGTVTGNKAEGLMTISGTSDKLAFRGTLSGDDLDMKLADVDEAGKANWTEPETIAFKRVSPTTPAEPEAKTSKLLKFSKAPTDVLKNGKEYTYASGGKVRYPASWSIQETEGALKLVPPDAGEEVILITGERAEGATDAGSPEVLAYLDSQVQSVLPDMKRVGKAEKASAGNGKGAFLTWEGTIQGKAGQVRGYVTILNGYGVALIALGPKEALDKRDKTLRDIFYSLGWGQGKKDTNLVGTWSYYAYSQISGKETKASARLNADGTFTYESNTEGGNNYSGKDGLGNETWTGWVNSRSGSGWKGTWTAVGGELTLNFEDGSSETFDYTLKQEGANIVLVVTGANKNKPMEWVRQSG